ncbi:MAG: putative toxin-antitoxin system toxin component, PIN family [Verrucomicrobiota bacterium]
MKLVLDTNILVSALMTEGTPPDALYQLWEAGRFELSTSEKQIDELRRVLSYEKLAPYINTIEASLLLENTNSMAEIVEVEQPCSESPDPDDNWILATATVAKADLLLTGDKNDLLKLKQIESIKIVSARNALEFFSS